MFEDEIEQEHKKVRLFARMIVRTKPKSATIKKIISIFINHMMYAEKLDTINDIEQVLNKN